jgi:hypothetical protein
MTHKRDSRFNKKLIVSFSENGFDGLGLTKNISRYGLCISSEIQLPQRHELALSLAVPGNVVNLKGEVVWSMDSGGVNENVPDQIGIRILNAPPEYLDYVDFIKFQRQTHPGSPLFDAVFPQPEKA